MVGPPLSDILLNAFTFLLVVLHPMATDKDKVGGGVGVFIIDHFIIVGLRPSGISRKRLVVQGVT